MKTIQKLFTCHVRIHFYTVISHNQCIYHPIDAGVVGDYSKAQIIVRQSSFIYITGVTDADNNFITDEKQETLDATVGLNVFMVLAWPTRLAFADIVSVDDNSLPGSNSK